MYDLKLTHEKAWDLLFITKDSIVWETRCPNSIGDIIEEWIEENLSGDYQLSISVKGIKHCRRVERTGYLTQRTRYNFAIIRFEKMEDVVAFKLRWL
jgi:hypothetical protein